MDFLTLLGVFNYGLVLIYGLFLSTYIAGGWTTQQQKRLTFMLCPLFLLIQSLCWLTWGVSTAKQLYPLIVHLPLVLFLIFALKKQVGVSLFSVCTAYLCCQLPRWVNLALTALTNSPLVGEIGYTLAIVPIYLLLHRFFVRVAHDAMTYSSQTMFLFGSLPFVYYVFDYATVIYSNALYAGIPALTEFFPTAVILFYVAFLAAYHAQTQRRTQAELQKSMLEIELKQSAAELDSLQRVETQTAIYQHNMRHHLTAINAFLSAGNFPQAEDYIKKVQADVEAITPKRFCENALVNLLCSSFSNKAAKKGIRLTVNAKLPQNLSVSDTELCALLSNSLENALHAVSELEEPLKWTELFCGIRANKFLIEIKNPYSGKITMRDGLPVSTQEGHGHGYGCRSIRSIAEQNGGLCAFEAKQGLFTLRVVLPCLSLDTPND